MADLGAVERQHAIHSKALGKPSQSGVADSEELLATSDSTLSWGRGGQIELNTSRGDTPGIPVGSGFSGAGFEHLRATPPAVGAPVRPDANHDQSWNMDDISGYPIGGGR